MDGLAPRTTGELVYIRLGEGGSVQLEGGRSVAVPDIPFPVRAADLEEYQGHQEIPLEVLVEGTLQALARPVRPAHAESYRRFLFEVEPSVDQLLMARGLTLANQGDWVQAAGRFEALVHLCPDHAVGWMNLGLCLLETSRERPDRRRRRQRAALRAFQQAVALDDRLAPAHFYLGCLHRDAGDETAARAAWRRCVALATLEEDVAHVARCLLAEDHARRDLDTLYEKGCLAVVEGRSEEGVRLLRRVVVARPDCWQGHFFLGLGLRQCHRYREALDAFSRVERYQPDEPEVWSELGLCQMELGRMEEAEVSLARALALQPENARARRNLGLLLMRQGKRLEARREFLHARELDGDRATTEEYLALLDEECGGFQALACPAV